MELSQSLDGRSTCVLHRTTVLFSRHLHSSVNLSHCTPRIREYKRNVRAIDLSRNVNKSIIMARSCPQLLHTFFSVSARSAQNYVIVMLMCGILRFISSPLRNICLPRAESPRERLLNGAKRANFDAIGGEIARL